jgi:uncharacterized membrane protein
MGFGLWKLIFILIVAYLGYRFAMGLIDSATTLLSATFWWMLP